MFPLQIIRNFPNTCCLLRSWRLGCFADYVSMHVAEVHAVDGVPCSHGVQVYKRVFMQVGGSVMITWPVFSVPSR